MNGRLNTAWRLLSNETAPLLARSSRAREVATAVSFHEGVGYFASALSGPDVTTVLAFFFARLFVSMPGLAPAAGAVFGLGLTIVSRVRQATYRPVRSRARAQGGTPSEAKQATSLLVRHSVRCSTTLQRLGALQQDQYNLAATCYIDLTAMFGTDVAEDFRKKHAIIFDRKQGGHDAAMLALGQDLRELANALDRGEAPLTWTDDAARHVEARLKGFMQERKHDHPR